ncbi:centrosome-associated zinc finger protein CP190 [Scaptodrosophila lebanonensis]|uniref:Centrosome-associated zinc finger protein CP190 n=1 Tax=Drosophila lebanonensis TaxID=7225 RepID=A0A6J2TJC8_DROLE|nr:centrosome-associated zinc finger protein CP190 [Scaptodrosophila lebanonensis]XP_030376139.1 centrosome-associated zinc finger protein CP190 [Scaptodrosophila lebanonensis]
MGEVKSVKVDNWGVFFLQKLQNFFNKTDYCDLTLQFRDNSQLKVHRLVLSACTDYFNVLEQTCEMVDDALIMPNEFQADVVVPIVNFMYTGTLEFELKMYGKLLRTAKEMNMTVLLKLLEAHRRTMENVNRQQRPPSPKGVRRRPVGPVTNVPQQRVTSPQSRTPLYTTGTVVSTTIRRTEPSTQRPVPKSVTPLMRTGGVNNRTQYITTSTETSPATMKQEAQPTSPFEQLRKGYNNNKRPAQTSLLSPPSKKPSLEDVKEFAEQQRMRKQIAAEYGDNDQEYDGMMLYDDVHAGDDDDDDLPPQPSTSKQQPQQQHQTQVTAQSGTQTTQMEHGTTTIILKQESPSQTPTIIVKDSSNTKLNHTKIIAEVLRQYPHIVKGHKNIKLKIMPNTPASPEKQTPAPRNSPAPAVAQQSTSPHKKLHVSFKSDKTTPMITPTQKTILRETTIQKLPTQNSQQTAAAATASTSSSASAAESTPQKRRIDSKTMHALIALGAENTTGPWLCLRCGVNGRPISIPSYRGFRRHLMNTHKETIDTALCEHCGWRSSNNRELHFHMYSEHQIKSMLYNFNECALCNQSYMTKAELDSHINEAHTDDNKQQCIYCNKVFDQEIQLYRHMKSSHKTQALEDGIIDETDEEYLVSQDEEDDVGNEDQQTHGDEKVRILSDISLPANSAIAQSQEEQLLQQATQEQEVKFVGADGNEVELTEEQRKEILSQLSQQQAGAGAGGVVMVLSEPDGDTKQDGDDKSATEEEYDDTQIYSELGGAASADDSKKSELNDSAPDESKDTIDNLEWAENLISEQEMEAEQSSKERKPENWRDDISEKLKELTGDWTEDENEDDPMEETSLNNDKSAAATTTTKQDEKPVEKEELVEVEEETIAEDPQQKNAAEADAADIEETEQISAEVQAAVEAAISIESTNKETEAGQEKMDVDSLINTTTAAATGSERAEEAVDDDEDVKKLLCIKKENETEEEFIAEPKVKADTTASVETSSVKAAAATEDDVHLEAENIRKELLDELIAQAEKAVPDDDDVPPTQLLPSDKIKIEKAEQQKAAEASLTPEAKSVASSVEQQATPTTTTAAETATTTLAEEQANTSEAANSREQEAVDSADKVKSLISEWVDDEDENGVSAAAKEEL